MYDSHLPVFQAQKSISSIHFVNNAFSMNSFDVLLLLNTFWYLIKLFGTKWHIDDMLIDVISLKML